MQYSVLRICTHIRRGCGGGLSRHGVLRAEVGEVSGRRRRGREAGQRPAALESRRELRHLRCNTTQGILDKGCCVKEYSVCARQPATTINTITPSSHKHSPTPQ